MDYPNLGARDLGNPSKDLGRSITTPTSNSSNFKCSGPFGTFYSANHFRIIPFVHFWHLKWNISFFFFIAICKKSKFITTYSGRTSYMYVSRTKQNSPQPYFQSANSVRRPTDLPGPSSDAPTPCWPPPHLLLSTREMAPKAPFPLGLQRYFLIAVMPHPKK